MQRHGLNQKKSMPLFFTYKSSGTLDKAYGTKEIRTYLHEQSARYTIPPKVNTKQPWLFDKETYKRRNVIERFFNRLK